jgi:hypothetical protein
MRNVSHNVSHNAYSWKGEVKGEVRSCACAAFMRIPVAEKFHNVPLAGPLGTFLDPAVIPQRILQPILLASYNASYSIIFEGILRLLEALSELLEGYMIPPVDSSFARL